ncbi:hypothetical protein [Methylobacterium nodulans]|uniref:Uncharacterized protein n=1 Tax=Methylobacterium nodulans (strain LMG 21967 / CNCM I-2342 / ORS 2060) TaxID=460265 RepID=B8IXY8_METNO|nr:hypothetical protein [Methylobacterium nodulans]ACL63278.1 conserved hypothetical protein [Methylobacterium nodulans ORS 2060]
MIRPADSLHHLAIAAEQATNLAAACTRQRTLITSLVARGDDPAGAEVRLARFETNFATVLATLRGRWHQLQGAVAAMEDKPGSSERNLDILQRAIAAIEARRDAESRELVRLTEAQQDTADAVQLLHDLDEALAALFKARARLEARRGT